MKYEYDLVVIGAGSGGVRAARMSAGFGAKVAVIESSHLGGTCVNVGCVPKKLFVYAASFADAFEDAPGFGWGRARPSFDWPALVEAKNNEIARLNKIYGKILTDAGVEIVEGRGRFVDPHTVRVGDRTLSAKKILIATGGKPWAPEIPGHELGTTSNDMFFLPKLPKRIVIAGGGYIGVEFASIFHGLGVETHLVHRHEFLLNRFDGDVRRHFTEQLRHRGIHAHLGHTIQSLQKRGEDIVATLDDGTQLAADLQMAAVGRRPNTQGLGLEEIGVDVDHDRGGVVVNDDFQTTVPHIYAIGDVIDRIQLTPVALAEGMAFAHTHYGDKPRGVDYESIPTAVFGTPQVGTVGLTEEEAWHRGEEVVVFRSVFTPMKNILAGRHEKMLMKLVVCAQTDKVFGVHVVGPDAGEIVQGFAVAMKCGATKAQLDHTVGIHPTAAEELVTMRTPVKK
ncbi:MAG: glutathione-disulfide reductase [Myxococcota bacterium]